MGVDTKKGKKSGTTGTPEKLDAVTRKIQRW